MTDSDQFAQRRSLMYFDLVAQNVCSLRGFLEEYAEHLPLTPEFVKDFTFRLIGMRRKCEFAVEEIHEALNHIDSRARVDADD